MFFKILLLVSVACLITQNEASDIVKGLPQAQVILQKFLNLVDAHQLNVSIVTSRAQLWSNGQLQDLRDNALLLPPNKVLLTQSQLTQQVGKEWLSDLRAWTSLGNGIATYRIISVQNDEVTEQLAESSNMEEIPMSPSYEAIITPEESVTDGLIPELGDYEIMYNYLIPGANGQNQSVNVFAVNLNITIIDNAEHMPLTQINQIKEILPKIWLMMQPNYDLIAQYLVEALNVQMPVSGSTWQVLIGPETFFVPSEKWVQLRITGIDVIVFTLAA